MLSPTPLPMLKLLVASTMVFCNTFMLTVLMPFMTFLIDDMKVAPTYQDIGRYSGYMVSSFMFGQLLFSYVWGYLSDRYGRRPVMLIGLFLTGTSFLSFGFVKNYYTALLIRFLCGAFNGIIGATKTYLSEITDETNQGSAFAAFGVARGLGMVLGPMVGGFLSNPSQKYPFYFIKGSLFDVYPYALPCAIGAFIAWTGTLGGYFVLQETNQSVLKTRAYQKILRDDGEKQTLLKDRYLENIHRHDSETEIYIKKNHIDDSQTEIYIQQDDIEAMSTIDEPRKLLQDGSVDSSAATLHESQPKSIYQMLRVRKVALSLALYASISFIYIQYDELFALWSRLPFDEGGLEFDSTTMGKAYSIGGISLFVYQLFFFSHIERYLGTLKTFQAGLLFSLPCFVLLPFATLFRGNNFIVWLIIGLAQVLRACAGVQSFTAIFLMVNNSISPESRGSLNGVGQTLGSLGRMSGPIFAGYIFSWSLENELGFPFDYRFVFIILSCIIALVYLTSLLVPVDIDKREL